MKRMKVLERHFDASATKKEFRQVLRFYDLWGRLTERKAAKIVLQSAQIQDGSRILDVACGTGELLEKIISLNPNGENTGIDLSPDMLDKARKKLSKHSRGNFNLQEGNALEMPFDDHSFDLLINNYMVDLLPENTFDQVASEFYRVLKPGGKVVMSTFSFGTKKIHWFWYWTAKHFPKLLTECRPVAFGNYLARAGFNIETIREISQNTFPSQVITATKVTQATNI